MLESIKGSTHITNSEESRTQRRQTILVEKKHYKATKGILFGAGIADKAQVSFSNDFSLKKV